MHLPILCCGPLSSFHFFVARSGLCSVVRKRSTLRLLQRSVCALCSLPDPDRNAASAMHEYVAWWCVLFVHGLQRTVSVVPPKHSDDAVDRLYVPSVLSLQSSNLSSSEYPICSPNAALCTVVSVSEPNAMLVSRIHLVQRLGGWRSCPYFPELFNRLLHDPFDHLRECCHRATATTVTLRAMARLRTR